MARAGRLSTPAISKEIIETGLTGYVLKYNVDKGYGFIEVANQGRYFMSITEVKDAPRLNNGKNYVQVNQIVKGDIAKGKKGLEFVNVKLTNRYKEQGPPSSVHNVRARVRPKKVEIEDSAWEELVCPICEKLLNDPLETDCHHVFCTTCVHKWVSNQPTCPLSECAKPCSISTLKPVTPNFCKMLKKITLTDR